MRTQQDHTVRVVALENLAAICDLHSMICHRYWIEKVTRSRVWVGYSNPDEYGSESPMFAIFPIYPSQYPGDEENPRVVLDIMRVINDTWDGGGWQAFDQILTTKKMWRDPDGTTWTVEA